MMSPIIPCPYCGAEIHDETERCPHCEHYISKEDAPPRASHGGSSSAWSFACTSSTDGTSGGEWSDSERKLASRGRLVSPFTWLRKLQRE